MNSYTVAQLFLLSKDTIVKGSLVIFDEFNELRNRRKQKAALEQSGEHVLTEEDAEALLEGDDTDFSAEATDVGGDDEAGHCYDHDV